MSRQHPKPSLVPQRLSARTIGWLLLVGALGLYGFNVLFLNPAETFQRNLWTWPDAPEYLDGALSLVREGQYVIHLAGQEHPPRYPFGFSLAVAAAYTLGADALTAPYRVNQACGLLLLLTVFWILHRRGRALEGGLAALLLSSLPAFVILCRSPMSEPLGALVLLWVAWLLFLHAGRRHPGLLSVAGAAGALLLGLSLNIRLANLFWTPLLAAAVLSPSSLKWSRRFSQGAMLGTCFLLGALPLFLYNYLTFGSVFSTGYAYWISHKSHFFNAFRLEHVPIQLAYLWSEFVQNEHFTTAAIYGHGSYFSPAFLLLCLPSLAVLRSRRFYWFSALGSAYPVSLLFYFYDDGRLYFPLAVLAVAPVAMGVCRLFRKLREGSASPAGQRRSHVLQRSLTVVLAILLTASVAAIPGPRGWSGTWTLLEKDSLKQRSRAYEMVGILMDRSPAAPRVVLTDMNVVYLHALLPWPVDVAPLTNTHLYRSNKENFDFKDGQRRDFIAARIEAGQTIYIASVDVDIDEVVEQPVLSDYVWEILERTERGGLLRLKGPGSPRQSH
ncbi:MAG TPA: hypothetical protein VLV83_04980 [Acidobacteriota bacterium]|nr:hypothetical protein [Acidobacteriota bacterium]